MANRVTGAADKIQAVIDAGGINGDLVGEKLAAFDAEMAVEFIESARYRDFNAEAFAGGLLTLDEANVVYEALGREGFPEGNGGWSKGTSTALKVAITSLMGELMARRSQLV